MRPEGIGSLGLSLGSCKINGLGGALPPRCGSTPPNGGAFGETAKPANWRIRPANWRDQVFRQNAAKGHFSLSSHSCDDVLFTANCCVYFFNSEF